MAKNPMMSAYLSAANRVANTARGQATSQARREAKRQTTSMTNAWFECVHPQDDPQAQEPLDRSGGPAPERLRSVRRRWPPCAQKRAGTAG